MKLPKDLTADPRHDAVLALLGKGTSPLWEGGLNSVATIPLNKGLADVLRGALHMGFAVQGLELITDKLVAEQKGLDAASEPDSPQRARVSRVLFLANDGSKRFYRDADGLLSRYAHRVMGCRLDIAGEALGETLFRTPKLVRSILVTDKKVVSRALLALVPESR